MKEIYKEQGLYPIEAQFRKAIELFEQLRQRTGVVIVGPSGAGKSTLWRSLRMALQKIGQRVIHHVLNPKSMAKPQVTRLDLALNILILATYAMPYVTSCVHLLKFLYHFIANCLLQI